MATSPPKSSIRTSSRRRCSSTAIRAASPSLRRSDMAPMTYDAIVVGSGISGGWAAKELTEHGLKTIVLEAGRPIDPAVDYVEHQRPWEKRYRGRGNRKEMER